MLFSSGLYNSTVSCVKPLATFSVDRARVQVYANRQELGYAAAQRVAELINRAIEERGKARIIAATGNSQIPLMEHLVRQPIQWESVALFHMDEYVGIDESHPASFRNWIRRRLAEKVRPGEVFYLAGNAPDLGSEIRRYSELLLEAPIDVAFVGFGENGHIAFNDPLVADFDDPLIVKEVVLEESSRKQQVNEGHFPNLASVPERAVTITCPGLFRAKSWVCCVPEQRKAEAVKNALEGPIEEVCPASLVRLHPDATVFLDQESASLLSQMGERATVSVTSEPFRQS
jgi:glucosamine-6-phosphate deaminase